MAKLWIPSIAEYTTLLNRSSKVCFNSNLVERDQFLQLCSQWSSWTVFRGCVVNTIVISHLMSCLHSGRYLGIESLGGDGRLTAPISGSRHHTHCFNLFILSSVSLNYMYLNSRYLMWLHFHGCSLYNDWNKASNIEVDHPEPSSPKKIKKAKGKKEVLTLALYLESYHWRPSGTRGSW